jgi:Protein of unknown function (DUF2379)
VPQPHPFDAIRAWSELNDAQLQAAFDDSAKTVVLEASRLLLDASLESNAVTRETFCEIVRDLRNSMQLGSRALGDAIILSRDLLDVGDVTGAMEAFESFLSKCTWPRYREIALSEIRALREAHKNT